MSTAYESDALERWQALQRYIPYAGLTVGTVLTMLIRDDDWPSRPVALGLAVAAALWVWLAAPPAGRLRVPGWLFFLGWTLLSAGLVLCSPCRRSRSTAPASG